MKIDVPRLLGNRPVLAGLVLVAIAALYGAAAFSRPPARSLAAGQSRVPVLSGVATCPDMSSTGKVKTRMSALTPAAVRGKGTAQVLEIKPGAEGAPLANLTTPGQAWKTDAKGDHGPYVVRASGAMAAGLEAEQTSVAGSGDSRGLAALRCGPPGIDTWFLAPGLAEAEDIQLHLVNVDDQPAAVDISGLSGDGPLNTINGRGIAVEPHESRVITLGEKEEGLDGAVEEARFLALRVQSQQGRVAAAAYVRMKDGKGVDWVPAAQSPTTGVVVPGVPAGSGVRRLLLAVPGDADARVNVQVINEKGGFNPEGRDVIDAPAQTVTPIELDQVLNERAAGVRISSNQPVLAGLVAEVKVGDVKDVGMTAPAAPLTERGVAADVRTKDGAEAKLLLTAPDQDAAVQIAAVTAQGAAGSPQLAQIKAGRTTSVKLSAPPGGEDGYGIVITPQPGSGSVYAARVLTTKKQGFTVMPMVSARSWVPAPRTTDSVTAIIP